MKPSLTAALIVASLFASAPSAGTAETGAADTKGARAPILLELFTSEGCSSCPPADRLLESLDAQPVPGADLIVVSEHVDYWNYLGWSDPYSSPVFSARQHDYSGRLGSTVYTPQLVVDGQFQTVGSDRGEVMAALGSAAKNAKTPLSLRAGRSGNALTVHVDANHTGVTADLYIVVAVNHARSQVLRGENGGHMLSHVAVAQSITRSEKWDGATKDLTVALKSTPVAGETRVIAVLQEQRTGRVLGVAQTKL